MKKTLMVLVCVLPLLGRGVLEVFASPDCGCCSLWADYMKKKGYEVKEHKTHDYRKIKEQHGIPLELQSCHTGMIENYVVEGHVPEQALHWLIAKKPKNVVGIIAPGMPMGSPGMNQGHMEEKYPIVLLLKNGDYKTLGIYRGDQLVQSFIKEIENQL